MRRLSFLILILLSQVVYSVDANSFYISDSVSDPIGVFPPDSRELEETLKTLPELNRLFTDHELRIKFDHYMRWLSSPDIDAPDAVYLLELVDKGVNTFDLQSEIFHELVEFNNWLRLGHRFSDLMNKDYYSQNYPIVYPIAHCNAVTSQIRLLNAFALRKGLKGAPMLAYDLVFPDYERRLVLGNYRPIPMLVRQLRFNQFEFDEAISKNDLVAAIQVFEAGGYSYKNSSSLFSDALAFLTFSRPERLNALKLQSITPCQSIQ